MEQLHDLFTLLSVGFALLIPLANPVTSMTMLLTLGAGLTKQERDKQVRQATIYVFSIMCVTYFAGTAIMGMFGISVPGLGIAGGLIICYIGFTMLFPAATSSETVEDIPEVSAKANAKRRVPNIAFVPLAMPGTAGPGTIAMIISGSSTLHSSHEGTFAAWTLYVAPVLLFVVISLIFWTCLRFADKLMKLMGEGGLEALSRIMGLLLVCMGVQFVINATTTLLHGMSAH